MEDKSSRRDFIKLIGMSGAMLAIPKGLESFAAGKRKPNVIFILADDLGYSDLSCYGQKRFKTPNIDKLALEGLRFTQAYSGSPVCAPSRCSLLTGKHTGHSYIRDNDEMNERGNVWSDQIKFEGQRPIPAGTFTLGHLFRNAGYKTACIGKWGLGAPETEGVPNKQGFDFFYGYNCQRIAHTHYPPYLWRNDEKEYLFENKYFVTHERLPEDKDPNIPKSYEKYKGKQYDFDLMLEESVQFINDNKNNPFFLYFTPTLPHVALQAPEDAIKEFENAFDETPYTGDKQYLPQQKPRAAYAAMITRLDRGVGKIMSLLKKLKLDEDTIVIFTSDNGATFKIGGYDPGFFMSNGDFRGAKADVYEGGIRIPLIARWPGKIKAGKETDQICAFWDFMPTFADLAQTKPASDTDGISIMPALTGKPEKQKQHEYLYWEHACKQQAVRFNDLKGIRKKPDGEIELYNIKLDPQEKNNIAKGYPEIVEHVKEMMINCRTESDLFPIFKEKTAK